MILHGFVAVAVLLGLACAPDLRSQPAPQPDAPRGAVDAAGCADSLKIRLYPDSDGDGFGVPSSWVWAKLSDISVKLGAGSTPLGGKSVYQTQGVKFLRSQNVWNEGLRLFDVARIDPMTHENMSGTHVAPGDLLLNITGASIGRCAVVPDDFDEGNVSQHVAIVRLAMTELRRFTHLCVVSSYFQRMIMQVQVGVSREGLSMKRLQDFPVAIPPIAEQKRIVAKVDELMRMLDDFEAKQTKKRETQARLRSAALGALTSAEVPEEFDAAWKRVAENFGVLFDGSKDVADIRALLVELAATGRLIAPDVTSITKVRKALVDRADVDDRMTARLQDLASPSEERGWVHVPLGQVLREPLANGRSVPDDPAGFPVLRLSALRGRFLDFNEHKLGAWTADDAEPFVVKTGDILFVRGNGALRLVGRACMAPEPPNPVAFPDTAIRARLRPRLMMAEWLWYIWESRLIRRQVEAAAKTTAPGSSR